MNPTIYAACFAGGIAVVMLMFSVLASLLLKRHGLLCISLSIGSGVLAGIVTTLPFLLTANVNVTQLAVGVGVAVAVSVWLALRQAFNSRTQSPASHEVRAA